MKTKARLSLFIALLLSLSGLRSQTIESDLIYVNDGRTIAIYYPASLKIGEEIRVEDSCLYNIHTGSYITDLRGKNVYIKVPKQNDKLFDSYLPISCPRDYSSRPDLLYYKLITVNSEQCLIDQNEYGMRLLRPRDRNSDKLFFTAFVDAGNLKSITKFQDYHYDNSDFPLARIDLVTYDRVFGYDVFKTENRKQTHTRFPFELIAIAIIFYLIAKAIYTKKFGRYGYWLMLAFLLALMFPALSYNFDIAFMVICLSIAALAWMLFAGIVSIHRLTGLIVLNLFCLWVIGSTWGYSFHLLIPLLGLGIFFLMRKLVGSWKEVASEVEANY